MPDKEASTAVLVHSTQSIKVRTPEQAAQLVERARDMLARAKDVPTAKAAKDIAAAAKQFLRMQAGAKQAAIDAGEIELLATRRLGGELAKRDKHPGGRPGKPVDDRRRVSVPPTLEQMGITRDESYTAQQVDRIDDDQLDQYLGECRAKEAVPSSHGARKYAERVRRDEASERNRERRQRREEYRRRVIEGMREDSEIVPMYTAYEAELRRANSLIPAGLEEGLRGIAKEIAGLDLPETPSESEAEAFAELNHRAQLVIAAYGRILRATRGHATAPDELCDVDGETVYYALDGSRRVVLSTGNGYRRTQAIYLDAAGVDALRARLAKDMPQE